MTVRNSYLQSEPLVDAPFLLDLDTCNCYQSALLTNLSEDYNTFSKKGKNIWNR